MSRKASGAIVAMAALTLGLPSLALAVPINLSTSGVFSNPVLESSGVTTGVGTNFFTWGTPISGSSSSSLGFAGVPSFSTSTETNFLLGTLEYHNGRIQTASGATGVDLEITLTFTIPAVPDQTFVFGLVLVNTPNVSDPDAAADYVFLPSSFSSTTFMFGGTEYTLEVLGFQNVIGDGFLASSGTEFHVREDLGASAELWGRVTADIPEPIPEPTTLLLLGSGLLGLFGRRRRG
jgi:hypothetical protein